MIGDLHDRTLLTSGGRRAPGPRRWHDRLVGDGGRRRRRARATRRRSRMRPGLAVLVGVVRIVSSGRRVSVSTSGTSPFLSLRLRKQPRSPECGTTAPCAANHFPAAGGDGDASVTSCRPLHAGANSSPLPAAEIDY